MAHLGDVLRHLITHAEGYATDALRQEHLDVIDDLDAAEAAHTGAVTGSGEGT